MPAKTPKSATPGTGVSVVAKNAALVLTDVTKVAK